MTAIEPFPIATGRRLSRLLILLLGLLSLGPQAVCASEATSALPDLHGHAGLEPRASLTLHDVVHRTAASEPGARLVAAQREQAEALARDAGRLLPDAPSMSASHVTDRIWTNDGYRQWDAGLELPLWWPGQRRGRREGAQAAGTVASHAEQVHLLEVAGWVRRSLAELELARVRQEIAQDEWHAEESLASQVDRAVDLEELAERDRLLAHSASLERRFHYLEALEESQHAEGNYRLLTGLSEFPARWEEPAAPPTTLQQHPQLLLANEEAALAAAQVRRLTSEQWGHPVLALGTQHERDGGGDDFNDRVVVGLQIPLGRRSNARPEIAAAQRALAQARRDAQRLERQLRGALSRSQHRLALADERIRTASEQARMAGEYQRLSELAFELGEADLATLLRARARAASAEQARREALILRRFSIAELNQALGVIP